MQEIEKELGFGSRNKDEMPHEFDAIKEEESKNEDVDILIDKLDSSPDAKEDSPEN